MTPRKVLVVDDEVHIVHVVAIKLRNNGYEPITAGNGQEAFQGSTAACHQPCWSRCSRKKTNLEAETANTVKAPNQP